MYKYTAIIVEPRKHAALKFVLLNFLNNLSDDWGIVIYHGNLNIEFVSNIIHSFDETQQTRIVKLVNLNVDNINRDQYTALFMDYAFYTHIPTETFLVFQTDCIILTENKDNINMFLEYDYVGAPWHFPTIRHTWLKVGNGGLSLRKKSKMLEILTSKVHDGIEPEDTFFSLNLGNIQCNIPDYTKAKFFS